jgi:hypothetical protein
VCDRFSVNAPENAMLKKYRSMFQKKSIEALSKRRLLWSADRSREEGAGKGICFVSFHTREMGSKPMDLLRIRMKTVENSITI